MDIDAQIANRVRALRRARGYTLEQLADASGVSRSMISVIERREASPTAAVLNKLADSLGVTLATLFAEEPHGAEEQPLARWADQAVWQDPASGYVRRQVSSNQYASPIDLVEVTFPPGESVTFEGSRNVVTHQQVWVLDGEMEIAVEDRTWRLQAGDCLAVELQRRLSFRNPGQRPARYAVALTTLPTVSKKTL